MAENPRPESARGIAHYLRRAAELTSEIEIDLREGIRTDDTERIAHVQMLATTAQTMLRLAEAEMAFADWLKRHQA